MAKGVFQTGKSAAHAYHSHSTHGRAVVLNKYYRAFQKCVRTQARHDVLMHAAHVAAWIAHAPSEELVHQAAVSEEALISPVLLLAKMLNARSQAKIPVRLKTLLVRVKDQVPSGRAFNCLTGIEQNAWLQLRKALPRRLKLSSGIVEPAEVAQCSEPAAEPLMEVGQGSEPAAEPLRFLNQAMNKWANVDNDGKTQALHELLARTANELGKEELQQVLFDAVGALSPPRAKAVGESATDMDELAQQRVQSTAKQQRIARKIVISMLREVARCPAVEPVFVFLQDIISQYEARCGDISSAAASKQWVELKQLVQGESAASEQSGYHLDWRTRYGANQGVFKPAVSEIVELAGGSATISEMFAVLERHPSLKSSLEERWPDLKCKLVASNFTKFLTRGQEERNGESIWSISEKPPRGVELRVGGARAFGKVQADGCVWRVHGPYRTTGTQAALDRRLWDSLRERHGQDYRRAIEEAVNKYGFDKHCKQVPPVALAAT